MATIKEVAEEVSSLVPKLIKSLQNEFEPIEDITQPQIIILMLLYEEGKKSVGEIAEKMDVSSPTVTGVVDRLVSNDYIERKRDPGDRRRVVVDLTPNGKNAVKQFQDGVRKKWEQILKHLSAEERKAYLRIIKKIISIVS